MDLWQPIAKHVLFPLQARREGNSVPRHLRELEESQWWPVERLEQMRLERLRALLRHAAAHCPFYTARFAESGFDPERVQSFGDLVGIPLLTKDDIRNHRDEMVATNVPRSQLVPNKTGGSTGQPLHFYMDRERQSSRDAAALRHDRWSGWDIGDPAAYIWGHRTDVTAPESLLSRLRVKYLDRALFLDTSSLDSARMDSFRRRLLHENPPYYVAYANSVYLYAKFLKDTGATEYQRPRAIITSAEMLDPERRALIEEVFGCLVLNRYGSRETSVIASQCEEAQGLHICWETLHLEFLRDEKPVAAGEPGKIVITDLMNYGMPLIRYDIQDVGIPSEAACACGRGLPVMEVSAGRVTDFLLGMEGQIVSGASLTIYLIANAPGVAQAQLVQERRGELVLRVVRGEGFGEATREFFTREIPRYFGDIAWRLDEVDSIAKDPSGKYRFSISHLDPAEVF